MVGDAAGDVGRVAGVEGGVGAAEEVDEVAGTRRSFHREGAKDAKTNKELFTDFTD